jgi:FAM177 family
MAFQATSAGSKALAVCDQVGESLAHFLGITGPKYRYEIEEAQRIQEEELAAKQAQDLEMAGWTETATPAAEGPKNAGENPTPLMNSPASIHVQEIAEGPARF